METRIANQIFSEEQILNTVAAYRERVRADDPSDLKLLLKKQCFNQHCKLEHEALDRAKVILTSILLSDMEVLFEPPEKTAITEAQTKILDILGSSEVPLSIADVALALEVDHGFAESEITELFDKGFICRMTTADESDDIETVTKYALGEKAAADASEPEDVVPDAEVSPDARRVFDVMPQKYWTVNELCQELGMGVNDMFKAIDELRNAGLVEPIGDSQFRVVESIAKVDSDDTPETEEPTDENA